MPWKPAKNRISGGLLPLVLVLVLIAPASVHAKWRGMTTTDSRIVFTGRTFDTYRAVYHHQPFAESGYKHERYLATWRAGGRHLPVFRIDLQILAPGRYFPGYMQSDPVEVAKRLPWFTGKAFSTGEIGAAETVLGKADYAVFTAGEDQCALFKSYFDDGTVDDPDTVGNVRLTGLYCPAFGPVDVGTLKAVLARIGVRDIAVPEGEVKEAAAPPASAKPASDPVADLVKAGDIRAMRRALAKGLDPDTVVAFRHRRFARGRTISAPMLMASAIYGHTEMVVFLLNNGASTRGPASGAICAAVARKHLDIVEVLLEEDEVLARYDRCGRERDLTPLQVAMRLGYLDIAETLQKAGSR